MKRRDLSFSLNNILDLIRGNIFSFILIIGLVYLVDYRDVFGGSNEIYYVLSTSLVLFVVVVIINKYKNPFQYHPHYVLFVKDRNDPMVKMEPVLDLLIIKLGLIKPDEFVNVRYSMYPDLDVGLDLDPNTGFITGFPMELGNHASEIKMQHLGGEYSTIIRIEVLDTLKEKTVAVSDELAPPRTVAQLLVREEDIKIREKELSSTIDERLSVLEREYRVKESSLEKRLKSEEESHLKTLSATRRAHEKELRDKVDSHEKELKDKDASHEKELRDKVDSHEKELKDKDASHEKELRDKFDSHEKELKDRDDTIDKLETEMIRALQDKEREFVEFEKETKLKFEEKKIELEESYKVEEEPEEEVVEEEPIEEEPEEEVGEEEPEEANYESMTVPQLKKLLKEKGLPVSGKKVDLISRLENNI